eukprot:11658948-Alexandrium_andersonii.AAC.1
MHKVRRAHRLYPAGALGTAVCGGGCTSCGARHTVSLCLRRASLGRHPALCLIALAPVASLG